MILTTQDVANIRERGYTTKPHDCVRLFDPGGRQSPGEFVITEREAASRTARCGNCDSVDFISEQRVARVPVSILRVGG